MGSMLLNMIMKKQIIGYFQTGIALIPKDMFAKSILKLIGTTYV